jgi:hypothetical protein
MNRTTFLLRWDELPLLEFLQGIKKYASDIARHRLSYCGWLRRTKHYKELKLMFPTASDDLVLLHLLSEHLKGLK